MKINGNAIRPGMVIEHQDRLWVAVKIQHTQPGKGGAYLQVELKGPARRDQAQRALPGRPENVERARLDQKRYQYLYEDGALLHFMDQDTYEQTSLARDLIGERMVFLHECMVVTIESYEGEAIGVDAAGYGGADRDRDRAGGEGPDGRRLLQARAARQRGQADGAAAHLRGASAWS